jgi:hypothetical protein
MTKIKTATALLRLLILPVLLASLGILLFLAWIHFCTHDFNENSSTRITKGMTYVEVTNLIGHPGDYRQQRSVFSEYSFPPIGEPKYWTSDYAQIIVFFDADQKVVHKFFEKNRFYNAGILEKLQRWLRL